MPVRELVQQVDGRLPDALPEAVGGGPEFPGFHLGRGFPGLGAQAAFVVAGAVRLAFAGSFVSRGVDDLVSLKRRASR